MRKLLLILVFLIGANICFAARSCVLLCHFNGVDGATTYISDDVNRRKATFVASAHLEQDQKKFGTTSLATASATSDYITFPDSSDWAFGTADFTIDFWVYFNTLQTDGTFMTFLDQYQDVNNRAGLYLYSPGGAGNPYQMIWRVVSASVTIIDRYSNNLTLSTGQWYHFALTKSNGNYYFFLAGIQSGTVADSVSVPNFSGSMYIGQRGDASRYLNGYIDEPRIVTGSAEWTANFTPLFGEYHYDGTPSSGDFFNFLR